MAICAEYRSIFGDGNVYLEISHHPKVEGHAVIIKKVAELSKESGIPLIVQQDVFYVEREDREAREVMRRIQNAHRIEGYNEEEDFSFIGEPEALARFPGMEDAVFRSGEIAERCAVSLNLGKWTFPDIPVTEGKTHAEELRMKAYRGIALRGLSETPEVKKRIEYELDIINGKGFAPYYLAVADLLGFARKENILTTTRGSAAGSLVAYLVGITNVNPLFYNLPFERFLNPERPKAPDIDMDIADNRRDEMIAYAKRTYGEDRVAQIGTFGTMLARAAVRDVARALGHPYR